MSWSSRNRERFYSDFITLVNDATQQQDAAINKLGGAKFQASQSAQLWGKVIPITYGKRRITGQPLQAGVLQQKTVNNIVWNYPGNYIEGRNYPTRRRTATFAYVFGAPGDPTANQLLIRLWINGTKVYDATTGERQPDINFGFFKGTEDQVPDATLNQQRYDFPVAYRGLMYVVFYDYVFPTDTYGAGTYTSQVNSNLTVEAEFWQENTNPIVSIPFLNGGGSPAPTSYGPTPGFDRKRGHVYNVDADNNIAHYDLATGNLIGSAQYTGNNETAFLGINDRNGTFFVEGGVPYYVLQASLTNSTRIHLIDAQTAQSVSFVGNSSGSLTPGPDAIQAVKAAANRRVGGRHEIALISVFNDLFILSAAGGVLRFERVAGDFAAVASTGMQPVYIRDAGWKVLSGTNIYNEDVTVYLAGVYNVFGVFETSAFDDLIVFEYKPGGPEFRIYRTTRAGVVVWEYNNVNSSFTFATADSNTWVDQSNTQGQFIAWCAGTVVYRLDMLAGTIETITGRTPLETAFLYDDYLRTAIDTNGSMGSYPIFNGNTANITLASLLRNLAIRQGYADADITITGIDDTIIGAAITEISDLTEIISDLKAAYNFEVVKRGRKILFTRRAFGGAFAPEGEITESDRAILEEDDEAFITLKSERADGEAAPGKVQLYFIDPDLKYVVNTVEHTRNDSQANLSETLSLKLPIIMTASEAATLAARVLVQATEGRMQHEFLLPQRFSAIEPGDYYELVTNDYTDVVKLVDVSYNADHSLLVKAEAVSTEIGPTITLEDYVVFEDAPRIYDELKALIIDTPLLSADDQSSADALEVYAAVTPAGRAAVGIGAVSRSENPTGPFDLVDNTSDVLLFGRLSQTVTELNSGIPWQYDEQDTLSVRIAQGDVDLLVDVTVLEMLAGANRLLVGDIGRWEMIGFTSVAYNAATKRATFTGLSRGMRGTEINISNHTSNDYVILVSNTMIVLDETIEVNRFGDEFFYAGVNGGGGYLIEDLVAFTANGNARKPWAVSNVRLEASGGGVDVTWQRRTRLDGPLLNGTPDVPLDEAAELYEADIYRAGTIVRTLTGLTSPGFTYTAAQQAADGFSGTLVSLQLDVYQISGLVGRGFVKAGTYDVE